MKITVYAKKRQTEDGRTFYTFLTTIRKKDGTDLTSRVVFGEDAKPLKPDACPCNIEFDKINANMSYKSYTDKDGNKQKSATLWIKEYTPSKDVYVDHSLDDFED